jgi:hypothetical protein
MSPAWRLLVIGTVSVILINRGARAQRLVMTDRDRLDLGRQPPDRPGMDRRRFLRARIRRPGLSERANEI